MSCHGRLAAHARAKQAALEREGCAPRSSPAAARATTRRCGSGTSTSGSASRSPRTSRPMPSGSASGIPARCFARCGSSAGTRPPPSPHPRGDQAAVTLSSDNLWLIACRQMPAAPVRSRSPLEDSASGIDDAQVPEAQPELARAFSPLDDPRRAAQLQLGQLLPGRRPQVSSWDPRSASAFIRSSRCIHPCSLSGSRACARSAGERARARAAGTRGRATRSHGRGRREAGGDRRARRRG